MGNMEFSIPNYFSTTMFSAFDESKIVNATVGISNLLNRDEKKLINFEQTITASGLNYITINLGKTITIDSFFLQNFSQSNISRLAIQYNDSLGSFKSFNLANSDTTTAIWTATGMISGDFLGILSSQTQTDKFYVVWLLTTTAGSVGSVWLGHLGLNGSIFQFSKNPAYDAFIPKLNSKQFLHQASDGGEIKYKIQDNYRVSIDQEFVSESEKTNLKTFYDLTTPFTFIPNPTGTSWDGKIYEVNWMNNWEFDTYSSNVRGNGYSGNIELAETPK